MPVLRLTIIIAAVLLVGQPGVGFGQDYIVGEGDLLKITVYDNPDLATIVRITGEGTILFPLIGQIKVAGLTVPQVSRKIADSLAEGFINSPQVAIFIEEYRSQKVTIMGQVNRPGLYELKGYTTFLEVLSKAGDLTKDAGDRAIVKRRAEGPDKKEKSITVDLKRLVGQGDASQDVSVLDGDSIYVVKASVFFVTGEVKKPDSYKLEDGLTVLKAITMAGGFTDKAATGRVKVIRKKADSEQLVERVKLDELVQADDVIVVPESFF